LILFGILVLSSLLQSCNSTGKQSQQESTLLDNDHKYVQEDSFTLFLPELETKPIDLYSLDTIHRSAHFDFIVHQTPDPSFPIKELAKNCETVYQEIINFIGSKKRPRIAYHIYQSAEEKGLILKNSLQAHVDFDQKKVHTVIHPSFEDNFIEKENELLIYELLGVPKLAVLQRGLGICFTKKWQRKGYEYWASRLQSSGNAMTVSELLDNDFFQQESNLIMGAMAGTFVDFLAERWGKEKLLSQYNSWQPDPATIEKLEIDWQDYLIKLVNRVPTTQIQKQSFPFLKGFNFAHEGYNIDNGYMSRKAAQSLARLANIGTNAITIIPYSYMRNPKQPSPLPLMNRAQTENDESVIYTSYIAKQLGMKTLLKPQIWIRGSWPGDIEMANEKNWGQFFNYYKNWILHYALLAEIHDIDLFCIGVEFEKATLSHEQEWVQLFKRIRGIYSGALTYSANWGTQVEQVNFWEELDYIGLSCYYPLTKSANANKKELKEGFEQTMNKLKKIQQKFNKPILLTEIGFRAIERPWQDPHQEPDGRPINSMHQKLCYETVFESLENQDWCEGIFWWKWPSHLEYDYPEGFTPLRQPAEKVIQDWFTRKMNK